MHGTMIWFNPEKRHGFIRTEGGERLRVDDAGFDPECVLANRRRGTKVSFERVCEDDDARAVKVAVVPIEVARRARLRGRR